MVGDHLRVKSSLAMQISAVLSLCICLEIDHYTINDNGDICIAGLKAFSRLSKIPTR